MATATKAVVKYRTKTVVVRGKRRRPKMTFPLAIVSGFLPLIHHEYEAFKSGGLKAVSIDSVRRLTGIDTYANEWAPKAMIGGLLPILGGILIHRFIGGTLGLNAALAKSGIPFIRI